MAKVSEATLAALDRASGKLASLALASMDEQFAWFGRMPADQRASVQLIAQTGAAGFTAYVRDQREAIRLTTDAFRQAPRELSRWISLRQTVELVRVALHVIEREMPDLAADDDERQVAHRGRAALRPRGRVHLRHVLRLRRRDPRRLGRPARGVRRGRDRPRRRRGVAAVPGRRARLGPRRAGHRPRRQLALRRSADRALRGPQPRRPRQPARCCSACRAPG